MASFDLTDENNLYDQFGNYVGPSLGDSDSESDDASESDNWSELVSPARRRDQPEDQDQDQEQQQEQEQSSNKNQHSVAKMSDVSSSQQRVVVLHEDKEYYPSASEVYMGAETMVEEEDTQPIETPVIEPVKQQCFELIEAQLPQTSFDFKYMAALMDQPQLVRNIAFVGHLHHGKTCFLDILVKETHLKEWSVAKEVRYSDSRKDEQSRGLSIKSVPISLVLPNLRGKHYLINSMDVPGHPNMSDEMTAALRLADGAVLFVDAAEGLLLNAERAIRHAAQQKTPIVLVINKVDRLIIELKLPPRDAYLKLVHTVAEVNSILKGCGLSPVSPLAGTVCFASASFGWSFTLQSFAKIYSDYHGSFDAASFAARLWGDWYLHSDRRFRRKPESDKSKRTFVDFILEPLYKIYAHVLGNDPSKLGSLMGELGVSLRKKDLQLDPKPLLNRLLGRFFSHSSGFVSMIVDHIPAPTNGGNRSKVLLNYTGDTNTAAGIGMLRCDARAPLVVNITKMYPRPDVSAFDAFGRVMSGTVRVGDRVRVLREGYSADDDEDMSVMTVEKIWIFQGRYRVEINRVTAGNWALFGGIDGAITKTATLTHSNSDGDGICIFRPLQFDTISVMKVAIEPIKPSELPKMTHGLRCINKSYPLCVTKVEESGEHVIIGTGEIYMDCMLHDLREMFAEIEIKVSDPVVSFCETVEETSSMQCFALTPNKKNRLTMICEPLEKRIASAIESEQCSIDWEPKRLGAYFEQHFGWDLMAGRHIWAFGPDKSGPNVLQDDTLPSEVDKKRLNLIRNSVAQGFQWGTREGPLCDEPIRNCRFKLVHATIAENTVDRGGGQIIPTARRVLYSSFMLATPKLMEPVLFIEAVCPPDCVKAVEDVVNHRRGRLVKEAPKPGTPFVVVNAEIPAIDSFGFETDLRSHTQGQAFALQVFQRWQTVPGDPMDENMRLVPLEPQEPNALAREFMIKTRKRKGLAETVTVGKYFDSEMYHAFAQVLEDE